MRILFVGDEEEYKKALEAREDGSPFSLFFSAGLPPNHVSASFDAILVPALRFLSQPSSAGVLIIVSGSGDIAHECFDAGCQDFIREPFTETELHARVMAKTRRRLEFGSTKVVAEGGLLHGPSTSVRLDDGMYGILALLNNSSYRPVPREAIAAILGVSANSSRAIDMRVSRLRNILRCVGASNLADCIRCKNGAYKLSR
jgi:DNA-binding response OmpR family regulator